MRQAKSLDNNNIVRGLLLKTYYTGEGVKKVKQVKFLDHKDNIVRGGIKLANDNIICACCGRIIKPYDPSITVLEVYPEWIDFSEAIID